MLGVLFRGKSSIFTIYCLCSNLLRVHLSARMGILKFRNNTNDLGDLMNKLLLGDQIRRVRKEKGLTQEKLSELAGITPNYLGEIERGIKTPGTDVLAKLSEALQVSMDYLLRNEVESGKHYIYDELTRKLENLTPKQRKTAVDILEAYIKNLD